MSRKLRLDDLRVDTFETMPVHKQRGTVFGGQCDESCDGTCDLSCGGTCASCGPTCDYFDPSCVFGGCNCNSRDSGCM